MERIQWGVKRVEKNVLMVKVVTEKIFGNEREILKNPLLDRESRRGFLFVKRKTLTFYYVLLHNRHKKGV